MRGGLDVYRYAEHVAVTATGFWLKLVVKGGWLRGGGGGGGCGKDLILVRCRGPLKLLGNA